MLKFIYRFFKHLGLFLLVSLPLTIIGIVILFPVVYFYNIGQLPYILRWFDSVDPYIKRNTDVIRRINEGLWLTDSELINPSKFQKIYYKYIWVAWRNPINYFSYMYLGFKLQYPYVLTDYSRPKQKVGDKDYPGFFYVEVKTQNKIYYEYYWIWKYSETKCLRVRLGYKIGQNQFLLEEYVQEVFVFSPYHTFYGEN